MQFWIQLVAGLLGAALKAYTSNDQATYSKKSISDIVIGAVAGGLFPLFVNILPDPISGLWVKANFAQQALLIFGMAFFSSAVLNDLLQKFGIAQNILSPAALKPPNGGGTMKSLIALLLIPLFALGSCSYVKGITASDVTERVLAAAGCVAALAGAYGQVSGDPLLGGAVTATNVINLVTSVGASNIPANIMSACASTIALASKDAAGIAELIKNTPPPTPAVTGAPPVARKAPAALIAKPALGADPIIVKVPLRKV